MTTNQGMDGRHERHSWRRRVSWTENRSSRETDMWGRVFDNEYVVCHKQDVCETCGQVREATDCTCDTARAERCTLRLAWIETAHTIADVRDPHSR